MSEIFKDLDYLKKLFKEIGGTGPIGLTFYPDGHWELWYGGKIDE